MPAYQIQTADWDDIDDLQNLASNSSRNSPLTNALLSHPPSSNTNNVQSRTTLAWHTYVQALQAQEATKPTSKVLKAVNTTGPDPEIQACAWLQWFPGNPNYGIPWIDEPGVKPTAPPCVNEAAHQYIENIKHSHRKTLMKGKAHYCV